MLSLTSRSRLVVLWPRGPLPEGLLTLPMDLPDFFRLAEAIGVDAALLLLTIRALRQRAAFDGMRVGDLGWILGVRRWWIARQLQILANAGQLVFDATRDDVIQIELTSPPDERPIFDDSEFAPGIRHEIPTYWFTQLLPRLGRRAFLAYLYIRSHEAKAPVWAFALADLRAACGAWSTLGARLLLLRLGRFGLIKSGRSGLLVGDPPPLRLPGRLYLRLLAAGAIPPTRMGRFLALLAVAVPFALLTFLMLL